MGLYSFPSDIMNSPEYGHMMVFTAYTPQSFAQAGLAEAGAQITGAINAIPNALGFENVVNNRNMFFREMLDQFQLYIPGGGQTVLSYQNVHEYDEVKMSRLGAGIASAIVGIGSDQIMGANALAGGLFRTQINPGVEVLYRGTELRRFDFSFMFAPQSQTDAQQLYGFGAPGGAAGAGDPGMLNRFRYHSAPEITGPANLLFKSPSEWEIDFLYKDANGAWIPNPKIPKITKGVLTRVDVDYNPDSEFSTFETGAPTSSRLTLRFLEMAIVDKTLIDQGY